MLRLFVGLGVFFFFFGLVEFVGFDELDPFMEIVVIPGTLSFSNFLFLLKWKENKNPNGMMNLWLALCGFVLSFYFFKRKDKKLGKFQFKLMVWNIDCLLLGII